MTSSSGSVNLVEKLTELRNTAVYQFFRKDIIKDADEELDKEVQKTA